MEEAMALGVDNVSSLHATYNPTPQEMLRSLPGINSKNYRNVMHNVNNMRQLLTMDLKALQGLLGNENARMLSEFVHKNVFLKERTDA